MKTAIFYISKHGATEKIAYHIADRLGQEAEVFSVKSRNLPDIKDFDCIILGTPVYAGEPLMKMIKFCDANKEALSRKKLGLFVSGLESKIDRREIELINAFPRELYDAAVARCFAGGELTMKKLKLTSRLLMNLLILLKAGPIDGHDISNIEFDSLDQFTNKLR